MTKPADSSKTLQAMEDLHSNIVANATDEVMKRLAPLVKFSESLNGLNGLAEPTAAEASVSLLFAVAHKLDQRFSTFEQVLSRTLLTCHVSIDAARDDAFKEYDLCMSDVRALTALSEHLPEHQRKSCVNRARRHLQRTLHLIHDLQVEVHTVEKGNDYNPDIEDCLQRVSTTNRDQDCKIARVDAPYFTWTNDAGQPDERRAKVVVYKYSEPATNGVKTRSQPKKTAA